MSGDYLKCKGFVAMIATVVISLVLVVSVLGTSYSSFSVRSTVFDREMKKTSYALAHSCFVQAVHEIKKQYTYIPGQGGDFVSFGSGVCSIERVIHGQEDPTTHKKSVTVHSQASVQGVYTHIVSEILVQNPQYSTGKRVEIISEYEVPTFP